MDETIIQIKKKADNLISLMGFDGESIVVTENGAVIVNLEVDAPALLIGRGGEGLEAIQHMMRLLAAEMLLERSLDLVVDIAGYRKKKAGNLSRIAKDKAYQVLSTGLPEVLPAMSAYERRIVHMACANIADIETESQGEGRERKVVIKPKRS